jgi:hypothetical protein
MNPEQNPHYLDLSAILENAHFSRLADLIRVPMFSSAWRQEYPQVDFWAKINTFHKLTAPGLKSIDRAAVLMAFTDLMDSIVQADSRLFHRTSDLDWLIQVLDGDQAHLILNLLKAWYSAQAEYFTPAELVEITGQAESTWRNKAAAGDIPGTIKKGKQWLIPSWTLRAMGEDI